MNHTHKFDKPTWLFIPELDHAEISEGSQADVVAIDFLDSGGLVLHYEVSGIYAIPPGMWKSVTTGFED